ncbi:MAG: glycosyltransferase, partial [Candidatus Bathyarchaeota archaeon]
ELSRGLFCLALGVSIVVPVYNEASILRMNTEVLRDFLEERFKSYEIILCENGSVDDTPEIARELAGEIEEVGFLQLTETNLAEALKVGFRAARSGKVIYFPIDLSVNLGFIPESMRLLDVFDVVIGSKRMLAGLDRRSPVRRIPSRAFHGMVRGLFGVEFTDSTCVKAFRRDTVLSLMERVPSSSRVFETELIAEAEKEGLYIAEVPVVVREDRPSRELLAIKVHRKLEDLLSARLNLISILIGTLMFLAGVLGVLVLTYEKIMSTTGGFANPYTFLIFMLLIISGFQMITIGLLSNLIMQIRAQVVGALKERREPV